MHTHKIEQNYVFEKCPCFVKVCGFHRMDTRIDCFLLCSQPYCKTKLTKEKKNKKKTQEFFEAPLKTFIHTDEGVSESNTAEQLHASKQYAVSEQVSKESKRAQTSDLAFGRERQRLTLDNSFLFVCLFCFVFCFFQLIFLFMLIFL